MAQQHGKNKTLEALKALRKRQDSQGLSVDKIKDINREQGLPTCPSAVTKLVLNCQMLEEISPCLAAEYTSCTILHLGRNKITRIDNLFGLCALRCLHLNNNNITSMQGLQGLANLQILDLSHNELTRIEGLEGLPSLEALLLAGNHLTTAQDCQHLKVVPGLVELDLSDNHLSDVDVLTVLELMPALQTLTLLHNPIAAASSTPSAAATTLAARAHTAPILPHYRHTVIARCVHLTALDHRPIFPQERTYSTAWWQMHVGGNLPEPEPAPEQQTPWQPSPLTSASSMTHHPTATHGVHGCPHAAPCLDQSLAPLHQAAAPGSACQHEDVLYGVLNRLEPGDLVKATLACRCWAMAAMPLLTAARKAKAQASLVKANAAVAGASLSDVRLSDLHELMAIHRPSSVLLQLMFALEVLWDKMQALRTARKAEEDSGSCQEQPAGLDSSSGQHQEGKDHADSTGVTSDLASVEPASTSCGACSQHHSIRDADQGASHEVGAQAVQPLHPEPPPVQEPSPPGVQGTGPPAQEPQPPAQEPPSQPAAQDTVSPVQDTAPRTGIKDTAPTAQDTGSPAQDPPSRPATQQADPLVQEPPPPTQQVQKPTPSSPSQIQEPPPPPQLQQIQEPSPPPQLQQIQEPPPPSPLSQQIQEPSPPPPPSQQVIATASDELDLDSATWRNHTWMRGLRMVMDRHFLKDLPLALPLTAAEVCHLRARTGSADDLDCFVPPLRASDVARASQGMASICQWLLCVEERAHALHQVEAAEAWTWSIPRQNQREAETR